MRLIVFGPLGSAVNACTFGQGSTSIRIGPLESPTTPTPDKIPAPTQLPTATIIPSPTPSPAATEIPTPLPIPTIITRIEGENYYIDRTGADTLKITTKVTRQTLADRGRGFQDAELYLYNQGCKIEEDKRAPLSVRSHLYKVNSGCLPNLALSTTQMAE